MNKRQIGDALENLGVDVRMAVRELCAQYRSSGHAEVLKQSVDTPHRARAQIAAWIANYNAANGAGTAQTFLAQCLVIAGSTKTLASIDGDLAALETQALVIVTHVNNDSWTWDQVATAIESAIAAPSNVDLSYADLPIPAGYTTVWGDPW